MIINVIIDMTVDITIDIVADMTVRPCIYTFIPVWQHRHPQERQWNLV